MKKIKKKHRILMAGLGVLAAFSTIGAVAVACNNQTKNRQLYSNGSTTLDPKQVARTVALVNVNDLHGAILENVVDNKIKKDGYGMIRVLNDINIIRQRYGKDNVSVVLGGDNYQGGLASDLTHGLMAGKALALLNPVESVVGNHEFDWGLEYLDPKHPRTASNMALAKQYMSLVEGPNDQGFQTFAQTLWPNQPKKKFLAANIFKKGTNELVDWVDPTSVIDFNGFKVGIVGLATEDTVRTTLFANIKDLDFGGKPENLAKIVDHYAEKLIKEQKVDTVVVLSHSFANEYELTRKRGDKTEVWRDGKVALKGTEGEAVEIIKNMTSNNVTAILAAHSHKLVNDKIRNKNGHQIIVAQGHSKANTISELRFNLNHENKLLWSEMIVNPRLSTAGEIDGTHFVPEADLLDPAKNKHYDQNLLAMKKVLDQAKAIEDKLDQDVLVQNNPTELKREYFGQGAVGSFVADLSADNLKYKHPTTGIEKPVDAVLWNAGGLRADIPAGPITKKDILTVAPFDNFFIMGEISVADLKKEFSNETKGKAPFGGKLRITKTDKGITKIEKKQADGSFKELNNDEKVIIAVNNFMWTDGDGYTFSKTLKNVDKRYDQDFENAIKYLLIRWLEQTPADKKATLMDKYQNFDAKDRYIDETTKTAATPTK
ncbi:hypothetical protein JM47_01500 [Ureaplasma diversum]|uniref:5'-nucleotidase n=1 Tax=Ureaplasma diversum TaxID=42094 RepID=A0A0C5RBP1_9BACT|nr:5'-nucleotidase C-terminal domain-containing protein [Ureaplasma diversum]AJQ45286.1 hypothetical protein JM47_01500 [Ureaplasma diversum]